MRYCKVFLVLAILVGVLVGWSSKVLSQDDYVPGMEQFPDIDITHYDLHAEFRTDTTAVNAKAIVEFEMKEARCDSVVFEIDRRARILKVKDEEGNLLKFRQQDDADYVVIYLVAPMNKKESAKIELEYVCNFPPLQEVESKPESVTDPRQGIYFLLWKWYPVNDYYSDFAPADFTFTVPKDYKVLTAGTRISTELQDDKKMSRWKSYGSLSCYFVLAGPFVRYTYGDQVPRIVIYMDTEEPDVANTAKEKAMEILKYYGELLCPYPYPVLNIVTSHARRGAFAPGGALVYLFFEAFSQISKFSDWRWGGELAHQWGDVINFRTPQDYCFLQASLHGYWSRLYVQFTKGDEEFRNHLELDRMTVLAGNEIAPITKWYTFDTESRIKDGRFIYSKGFYVLHMLRHIIGDEKFFGMMKKLVQNFHMKPAGIRDVQKLTEELYGQSLGWFFDQWVFGTGIPEYGLAYHISPRGKGKYKVSGHITQKLVKFRMPVEMVAMSKDQSQTHQIMAEQLDNPFQFEVPFKPDTVLLDPEFKVLRWDKDIKVWVYTQQGKELRYSENYEEAAKLLDSALAINPGCSWAAFEKGCLAYDQGQYQLAIQYYTQALSGDLDFHLTAWTSAQMEQGTYLMLGLSYDLLDQRKEAIASYQKVIEMGQDPVFPRVYEQAKRYIEEPYSEP